MLVDFMFCLGESKGDIDMTVIYARVDFTFSSGESKGDY